MEKYSWDFDNNAEIWNNGPFNTVDECIEDAKATAKGYNEDYHETVYIGENDPYIPIVDAESVLDNIEEQAAEFAGEIGSEWEAYNYKKQDELNELSEELSSVVINWMKKHGYEPNFYAVENIKAYKLNADKEE